MTAVSQRLLIALAAKLADRRELLRQSECPQKCLQENLQNTTPFGNEGV
jgi:hypothetical protein